MILWGVPYQKYEHLFEQQKTKKILGDKRQKLTQASKANKLIYKDRK